MSNDNYTPRESLNEKAARCSDVYKEWNFARRAVCGASYCVGVMSGVAKRLYQSKIQGKKNNHTGVPHDIAVDTHIVGAAATFLFVGALPWAGTVVGSFLADAYRDKKSGERFTAFRAGYHCGLN